MKLKLKITFLLLLAPATLAQPTITTQPADQTANQGFDATFQIRANGTFPVSYTWFFHQSPVEGATTNRLTITNTQPSSAGDYFAVVSDSFGSATSRIARLTVIPPAVLASKIGPNVRMGVDPDKLPATNRSEAEIHIQRNPRDSRVLLATFQEARQTSAGGLALGYATSPDGGLHWERGLAPGLGTLFGRANNVSDPVAGFDGNGNAYLNSLDNSVGGLALSRSPDGLNFDLPQRLTVTRPDKNWMAINTHSNSSTANRIVLTWTEYNDAFNASVGIRSAYSDDFGATWSKPKNVINQERYGSQPFFFPDGSFAVIHNDGYTKIEIATSSDGGETFQPSRPVTSFTLYDEPRVRAPGHFPSATTDHQRGIIYLSYQALFGQGTNRRPAIMFTRSIDRGLTWTTPVPVNDTPDKRSVFTPAIAASADGQHLLIEFYDRRHDTGTGYLADLYLAESFDGGDTWEPNLRVSEFTTDMRSAPNTSQGLMYGDYQGIVPSVGMDIPAVAAWIDARSGSSDPFSAQIQRTRGTTFETWRKLRWNTNDLANLAISGPAADPDRDGIPNFAEYAFGLEPDQSSGPVLKLCSFCPASPSELRLTFQRPSVVTDVDFVWEQSTDLITWSSVKTPPNQVAPGKGTESFWALELPLEMAKFGKMFLRVVALSKGTPP